MWFVVLVFLALSLFPYDRRVGRSGLCLLLSGFVIAEGLERADVESTRLWHDDQKRSTHLFLLLGEAVVLAINIEIIFRHFSCVYLAQMGRM